MVEKKAHLKLKEEAIKLLKSLGYKDDEILQEYPIYPLTHHKKHEDYTYDGRKQLFVDIVAIQNGEIKLMIECGNVTQKKLDSLNLFGKVIILPYPKQENRKSNKYYINKSVSLTKEQINFIDNQSRFFNLSKFVQNKLNEYILLKEDINNLN